MRTKHFFKNVKMLTIALALCAAFAATMSGCKKDTTPETPTWTLTATCTVDTVARAYSILSFACSTDRIFSGDIYYVIDTVPDMSRKSARKAEKGLDLQHFYLTETIRHLESGPAKYYITPCYITNSNGHDEYHTGNTMTYDAPVSTEFKYSARLENITAHTADVVLEFSLSVNLGMITDDPTYIPYARTFLSVESEFPIEEQEFPIPPFEGKTVTIKMDNFKSEQEYQCQFPGVYFEGDWYHVNQVAFTTLPE